MGDDKAGHLEGGDDGLDDECYEGIKLSIRACFGQGNEKIVCQVIEPTPWLIAAIAASP